MNNKIIIKIISVFMLISIFVLLVFKDSYNYSYDNMDLKENVVFYVQHQDDETLWVSSVILKAINEKHRDHVYIVEVSSGVNSKEFKEDKKFDNVTITEKYEYREREFLAAVKQLGIKDENIILIPRINNGSVSSFTLMKKIALDYENKLNSVTHIAHTYKYDNHSEHIKNGKIIQYLYKQGKIKDVKYFVKPKFEQQIPKKEKIIYKTINEIDRKKIRKACEEYKKVDDNEKRAGIGYKSDNLSFDRLLRNYESVLHTGNIN